MNKVEPIKIGFPTNSRLAEDCKPLREALELEGSQGTFRSRFVPDAVFRPARVKDIARFLKEGIYRLGILGDDTAVEMDLEEPDSTFEEISSADTERPNRESQKIWFFDTEPREITEGRFTPKLISIVSRSRSENFTVGEKTFLALLRKKEQSTERSGGIVLTSYPNLSRKIINSDRNLKMWARVKKIALQPNIDGQIEALVRTDDIPNTVGGIDIVRTGKTMNEYDLSPTFLFKSQPGLWIGQNIPAAQLEQTAATIQAMRELFANFICI